MKAIVITRPGDVDVLQVLDRPVPAIGVHQVLIKVHAAGVNFADLVARIGLYEDAPKIPCVVGYEVSGIVEAVGPQVTRFKVGERVTSTSHFGGYAEYTACDETLAVRIPDSMSFEEGAVIPVNYLTAYHMMFIVGNLRPGQAS